MDKTAFQMKGVADALRRYGAGVLHSAKDVIKNPRQLIPSMEDVKRGVIGQPGEVARQFRSGSLFNRDGLLMQSLKPRGPVDALQLYGLPAMQMYQAYNVPEEFRGQAVGSAAGNFVGGMLGAPLGMVGSTIGGLSLGALGQNIGKSFDQPSDRQY